MCPHASPKPSFDAISLSHPKRYRIVNHPSIVSLHIAANRLFFHLPQYYRISPFFAKSMFFYRISHIYRFRRWWLHMYKGRHPMAPPRRDMPTARQPSDRIPQINGSHRIVSLPFILHRIAIAYILYTLSLLRSRYAIAHSDIGDRHIASRICI